MVAATGAVAAEPSVAATTNGYQQLFELAAHHDSERVWAIESTGSLGAIGAATVGVVVLDEPANPGRVLALAMILAGVILLRLTGSSTST